MKNKIAVRNDMGVLIAYISNPLFYALMRDYKGHWVSFSNGAKWMLDEAVELTPPCRSDEKITLHFWHGYTFANT